jgi:PhnB protein
MTQVNPYLRFDGNCREAMSFYKDCLGADLALTTVGETPVAKQMPSGEHKRVMHATLTKGSLRILGSDMVGPEGLVKGNAFTLQVECGSEEEIRTLFSKLSSGGEATYPVNPSFWGGLFGQLTDKFGNAWMLNYATQLKA